MHLRMKWFGVWGLEKKISKKLKNNEKKLAYRCTFIYNSQKLKGVDPNVRTSSKHF